MKITKEEEEEEEGGECNLKIEMTDVNGILDSVRYSGLPKDTKKDLVLSKSDFNRGDRLANAPSGSGHDCFMKGITLTALITAPQYWWLQFGRYHFADIISSQSKMHRITKMKLDEQCNEYVDEVIKLRLEHLLFLYEKGEVNFQQVISNVPMGLNLAAGVVTNYLQLKTIYNQRRNHKLKEWQIFCDWVEDLPYSKMIIGKRKEEKK